MCMATSSVGAYEAKTHLPRLLDEVERGSSITITKHGRAVARLVPVSGRSSTPLTVIAELRQARVGVRRGEDSVREMIEHGRR
jgi:prevent-host-death family protein